MEDDMKIGQSPLTKTDDIDQSDEKLCQKMWCRHPKKIHTRFDDIQIPWDLEKKCRLFLNTLELTNSEKHQLYELTKLLREC